MKRFRSDRLATLTIATLAALVYVLLAGAAPRQQPAPVSSVAAEAKFEAINLPARFRLVQVVVDFPPSTATSWYTPGGQGFVTVIAGAVTVRRAGDETTYQAGQSYLDQAGQLLAVSNATPATARLLMAFLLPEEAPLTIFDGTAENYGLPPGPTVVAFAGFELADLPAELDVVQRVVDFEVGAVAPAHVHPGPSFVTLLAGEVFLCMGGVEQRFEPGDTWLEPTGVPHSGVGGPAPVRVAATTLLPKGAPLIRLVGDCTDGPRTDGATAEGGLAGAQ